MDDKKILYYSNIIYNATRKTRQIDNQYWSFAIYIDIPAILTFMRAKKGCIEYQRGGKKHFADIFCFTKKKRQYGYKEDVLPVYKAD